MQNEMVINQNYLLKSIMKMRREMYISVEGISMEPVLFSRDVIHIASGEYKLDSKTGKNYTEEIITNCLKYSKNLISFGDFKESEYYMKQFKLRKLSLYIPQVKKSDIPDIFNGKLRCIGSPIIGIFGTSSMQGKFSLQVRLTNYFKNNGYKVGCLGTEPSSKLFGFDEVYPMGYESTVETNGRESIAVLNKMLGNLEDKGTDIIIVSSQSQTIPHNTGNLNLYLLEQHEFLLATEPDAVLLCVNLFDEEKYIERTVNYIEALVDTRIIAFVLFPMERECVDGILTNKLVNSTQEQICAKKKRLEKRFHKPIFVSDEPIDELGMLCEDFFS